MIQIYKGFFFFLAHPAFSLEYSGEGRNIGTSSMVLTTLAIEIEPLSHVSYLGIQPVGSLIFISQWLQVFDSIMIVSIFCLKRCLFIYFI